MEKDLELWDFLEIEKKYNLYRDTIEGIHYWVYARFILWGDFFIKSHLNLGNAHSNKNLTTGEKLRIFTDLLKNSFGRSERLQGQTEILFISHPRRVWTQKGYECIYTDQLAKRFTNSITYEQPHQWKHLKPFYTSRVIYGDRTLLKKGIYLLLYKTLLKRKYHSLLKKIKEKTKAPIEEMEKKYGFFVNKDKMAEAMATQIIFYKASVKDLDNLLTRLSPKAVVEVVGYNPFCMLVNEICKRKGIPTIELQHGAMNRHMGYEYEQNGGILQFPDKMFLFSEHWKNTINVPVTDENLIVTGFPFLEGKLREATGILKYQDGKTNILFISQGTIGDRLSVLARDLSLALDTSKYRILYKLHPGEFSVWKEKYGNLLDSNVEVVEESKHAIYDYFKICEIQVGVYSTALYEGLAFGLATFIYEIEMSGHMKNMEKEGYVTFVKDHNEMIRHMESKVSMKKTYRDFWAMDSLNKMEDYIKELL